MAYTKSSLYEYFDHMQSENDKCMIGGMGWDDIVWHMHYASELGIADEELAKDFPRLLGYITK